MRKRTILALMAICVIVSIVKASPVDPQSAIQVAQQFVPKSTTAQRAPMRGSSAEPSSSIVYTHMMPNSDRPAFYIVNVDDGAFVLVSADDIAHQVLGYSLSSAWPVSNDGSVELPEHIRGFFDDLAAQMEAAIETEPNRAPESDWTSSRSLAPSRSDSSLPDSVGPLLTTTWDQGQYYNALCPEDADGPGGHAQTGCVATAMAQIVKYWSDPTPGRGTHSYETNYGELTVNYEAITYDFDDMPSVLTESSTQQQISAIAKLMYHCGVATNMNYGPYESSAYVVDARAGLINFFRFSPDLSYAEKNVFTNEEWNNLLRENIAANCPMIYSGQSDNGGHSFVCDGYDSKDFFHFNFGWGGFCDGWYLTTSVTPSFNDFSSSQYALVGIVPDISSNIVIASLTGVNCFELNEPILFYGFLSNNRFAIRSYAGGEVRPNSITQFIIQDTNSIIDVDVLEFESNWILIHNGLTTKQLQFSDLMYYYDDDNQSDTLRYLNSVFLYNNTSPIISRTNSVSLCYYGYLTYCPDVKLRISQDTNCRTPSTPQCTYTDSGMNVSWQEYGTASSWQVEFGLSGFIQGNGTIVNSSSTNITISDLQNLEKYDFYVRSKSNNGDYSEWSGKTTEVAGLYWHNIVTKQPLGYSVADDGTILISTADALAWWAKNGPMWGNAQLTADIDMGAYRWKPIKFFGSFNGNGHKICNLYIYEPQKQSGEGVGFMGSITDGIIDNLTLEQPKVLGRVTGSIAGYSTRSSILNCSVIDGNVSGSLTGALVGWHSDGSIINCFATGTVTHRIELGSDGKIGGLCGNTSDGSLINCYSACRLYNYNALNEKGNICGYIDLFYQISHCYYYPTGSLVAVGDSNDICPINDTLFRNVSAIYTVNDIYYLNNNCIINNVNYSNLTDALNAWVYAKYSEGHYRHWMADTANANGGFPIFAPMPKCIVAFKNANGDTLQIDTLENGSRPVYRGSVPTLESTPQYAYTFREWSAALTPITGDVTFTALYDAHMFGDVTDNAAVDVQDATIVVNYILGERPEGYLYHMADMNNDTVIDVFDLTAIINIILDRTSFLAPMRTSSSGYETYTYLSGNRTTNIVREEDVSLLTISDKIGVSINNTSRFTSFQMDVEVPDGAELQNVELTGCERTHIVQKAKIGDNMYRVIALSMSSQPLADVNDELVNFQITNAANAEISVSNVMFVTPKGEAHYFNGASTMTPTIINEITTDNDEVIFDLSGRRIYKKPNELERGVYIIDKKKVVIK